MQASWSHFGATDSALIGSPIEGNVMYSGPAAEQRVLRVGWPMRALQCEYTEDWGDDRWGWTGGISNPLRDLAADPSIDVLPVRVIPLGFLVNSSLVAAPLVLIAGFRTLRRSLRMRAGRCDSCGHQLLTSQHACPECGAARETVQHME